MVDVADGRLCTIGELARLTGVSVKTIRFWSEQGLVPPADRTPTGYRLYGHDAHVRLELVRTLRDLDVDVATIRKIVDRKVGVAEVARAHAAALQVRIDSMRLQRSVLEAIAGRGSTTAEEITLMHKLAQLSDSERRQLVNDFIDETFAGLDLGDDFLPQMRAVMPDLPDDPTQTQLAAWIELGELVQDRDFRASLRKAAVEQARAVTEVGDVGAEAHRSLADLLQAKAGAAAEAGLAPESPEAQPVLDELVAAYAAHTGRVDGPSFRAWLLHLLESSGDRRYERYWQLLAVINGQPVGPSIMPAAEWLTAALRNATASQSQPR